MVNFGRRRFLCSLCTFVVLWSCSGAQDISFNNDSPDSNLPPCTTPDNRPGRCIRLPLCPELTAKLNRPTSANLAYLQKAICTFSGKEPILCCASAGTRPSPPPPITRPPPSPVTTTTTTTAPVPVPSASIDDICGIVNLPTGVRIVGGTPAPKGAWPWAIALFYSETGASKRFDCGGTLISKRYVLTAAHCVVVRRTGALKPADKFTVRVGEHDISKENEAVTDDIGVDKIIAHPEYSTKTHINDIALMLLSADANFRDNVKPACLPFSNYRSNNLEQYSPWVVGWGKVGFTESQSPILMQVSVPVVSNDECQEVYQKFRITVTKGQMCAGTTEGGKDACQGDSGGPALISDNTRGDPRYMVVGVVSFGYKCAEPGTPGIYTRVTEYVDWIRENTDLP